MDIINVEIRDGKTKAKHLRKMGIVPCSVYGGSLPEAVSIQMNQQTANLLCQQKHDGSRVNLKLNGKVIPTQIKEYTRNFENRNIDHISFQALKAGQMVNSVAQIYRKNCDNVRGVIEQMIDEVAYEALPENMLECVTLDLENAAVGTVITIADIPELNQDTLTLKIPTDSIVLRVTEAKAAPVEEEAEEPAAE